MPTTSVNKSNREDSDLRLVSENLKPITARIILTCPTCGYHRRFRNQFTYDKMDLIIVTLKIVDWLTCERCSDILNCQVEYNI
ncbi:MAG: hypothetical protein GF364_19885 [Candidatus Lokiarchaeota archaeon]|nr:hypothetical protein [Candidatus Lokiarchaeota archaeon]